MEKKPAILVTRIVKLDRHHDVIVGRDLSKIFEDGMVYDVKKVMDVFILTPIGKSAHMAVAKKRFPSFNSDHDPLPVNPEYIRLHNCKEFKDGFDGSTYMRAQPEFWAYFGDYDWVVLCSLFGTVMDLPEGFPMYCRDVKQLLDERVREVLRPGYASELENVPLEECIRQFELLPGYPVNLRPHLSKEDARQEKLLYEFLTKKI